MAVLAIHEARDLVAAALRRAGANDAMAAATAHALVLAESQGLASHGLSRVAQYAAHLRNGRVNGDAVPTVVKQKGATALVDAQEAWRSQRASVRSHTQSSGPASSALRSSA